MRIARPPSTTRGTSISGAGFASLQQYNIHDRPHRRWLEHPSAPIPGGIPPNLTTGDLMTPYIDAILIPVPRANLDRYKKMSEEWGKAHLRHGALYFSDSIGDDVQPGKLTSFPQAVQLKDDEVVALSWVVYKNKDDRDRIAKAVMEDAQLKEAMGDPPNMPFDGKRMFWGGFQSYLGLSAGS
jgi:uncharacterized protein YbaA (DUF1428 family)